MQYLVALVQIGQQTPHVECTTAVLCCRIICRDFSELVLSVPVYYFSKPIASPLESPE